MDTLDPSGCIVYVVYYDDPVYPRTALCGIFSRPIKAREFICGMVKKGFEEECYTIDVETIR